MGGHDLALALGGRAKMDFEMRRAKVQQAMNREGIDLLAVPPGPHMHYLLGWHPHVDERPCFLFMTGIAAALLIPSLNEQAARAHVTLPMEAYTDADGPGQALGRLVESLAVVRSPRVLVDEAMRFDFLAHLHEHLRGASVASAAPLLGGMRMRKDTDELEALVANARMADAAVEAARRSLRVGMRELDVADAVAAAFAAQGARMYGAIIGSGPNSALPHHATGQRRLQIGDAVVMDVGAAATGYNSDITRMVFVGEPDATYLHVHGIVEQAVRAAVEAVKPGARACDVDRAARGVIAAAGFAEYFTHRTGHGLGIQVHEPPYITGTNELVLEPGMTFSIEPGIYLPGRFGVRLEEIVVVHEGGAKILSGLSREVFRAPAQDC